MTNQIKPGITAEELESKLINDIKGNAIVRRNLLQDPNYTGYCGVSISVKCSMPRTVWQPDLGQFKCPCCGWVSKYPNNFIEYYRKKWNK